MPAPATATATGGTGGISSDPFNPANGGTLSAASASPPPTGTLAATSVPAIPGNPSGTPSGAPGGRGITYQKAERVWKTGDQWSPDEKYTINSGETLRTFLFFWNDRIGAATQALGYSWLSGTTLHRWCPEVHPQATWQVCTGVEKTKGIKYLGKNTTAYGPVNRFWFAEMTLKYGYVPYLCLTDSELQSTYGGAELNRFVSFRAVPAGSFLTIPAGLLSWRPKAPDTKPEGAIPYGVGKPEYAETLYYKWWYLPYGALTTGSYLDTLIQSYYNTTNLTTFDGRPPGTLILENAEREIDRFGNGEWCWHLTYQMRFNYNGGKGHNYKLGVVTDGSPPAFKYTFVSPGPTQYDPGSIPDNAGLYNEREFANLFKFG